MPQILCCYRLESPCVDLVLLQLLLLLATTVRRRARQQAPLARRRWNGRYGAIFRKDEIVRRRDSRSRIATDDVLLQTAPARRRLLATAALRFSARNAGQALLRRKTRHGGRSGDWSLFFWICDSSVCLSTDALISPQGPGAEICHSGGLSSARRSRDSGLSGGFIGDAGGEFSTCGRRTRRRSRIL